MNKSFPLLILASASSMFFSGAAFAGVPNIGGTWKVSISGESLAPTFNLIQDGNSLTGTLTGTPMGDLPITGTVSDDNKVSFAANGGMGSLKFTATVQDGAMQGVADLPFGRKDFTATK